MTNNTSENPTLADLLHEAQCKLSVDSRDKNSLHEIAMDLSQFADTALESSSMELFRGADLCSRVLELAACWYSEFQDDPDLVDELTGFVDTTLPILETAARSGHSNGEIDALVRPAEEQWNDYLSLIAGKELPEDNWDVADDPIDTSTHLTINDENEGIADSQIELLLSAVSESSSDTSGSGTTDIGSNLQNEEPNLPASQFKSQETTDAAAKLELSNDRELLEAYLDDALRCLSSMEVSALAMEDSAEFREPINQFCRELHTLKGASATVGLAELAAYLHELESSLQSTFEGDTTEVQAEPLFVAVDRVRAEISSLQRCDVERVCQAGSENQLERSSNLPKVKGDFSPFTGNDDASIRIRATKLDRLMDMLAELVVLRNRRESHVAEFNDFNEELARCASRLSYAEEQVQFDNTTEPGSSNPFVRNSSCTFSEVAKDITAVSNGMRGLQKPVSLDNAAISRFIRDFRQELMQLRRIPVSGLFHRLQRAARDAAKSENKQVQVQVVGENAGLEQEIQERLFESLLHVVRNSVSHGIEPEENRIKAGKNSQGTITLEASSNAQLLMIEVRDDGNGLDHEAVRKRAIEKGLLSPNHRASNSELAQLIFHPGFSTREQASAVSGRGVGMDIVAKTIEKLHGRVEVDSVAGQGTTIRLTIPLRTGIEHVMVFSVRRTTVCIADAVSYSGQIFEY